MKTAYIPLYDRESSKAIEEIALKESEFNSIALIRRAAERALITLLDKWPATKSLAIFCGTGNNGSDGLVLALFAKKIGLSVSVYLVGSGASKGNEAQKCKEECLKNGLSLQEPNRFEGNCDLVVDAIFGMGLNRPIEGVASQAVSIINDSKKLVFSLDVPSGVDCSSGSFRGTAVRADFTLCFLALKQGLFTGFGKAAAGEVRLDTLGLEDTLKHRVDATARAISYSHLKGVFTPKDIASHKGNFGHLLILGGAPGYSGAALLCSTAALRAGVGLTSLGTHPAHASFLTNGWPEIMCHGITRGSDLMPLLKKSSALAIGPGLSTKPWATQIFKTVEGLQVPTVYDADALNLLAADPSYKRSRITTPHSGEAARLLGLKVDEVEADRFSAVSKISEKFGGTSLLKGPGTLIKRGREAPYVLLDGNPGMATGGMGDVLTGVIGSFLAQGFTQEESAVMGAAVHSRAGDLIAEKFGEVGLRPSELLEEIRSVVNLRDE